MAAKEDSQESDEWRADAERPPYSQGGHTTLSTNAGDPSIELTVGQAAPASAGNRVEYFGDYRVLNLIAVHGQGAVYRADHPHLNRQVVIKVSKRTLDQARQQELVAEGRTLATLSHPNLAQVYDLQFEHGRPYLVMEFVEGRNLHDLLKESRLPTERVVELVATLADAMSSAHAKGVVHHDLKPANIMIRAVDGVPKIIDFGLARADTAYAASEGSRTYGGTIAYIAPEQAKLLISKSDQLAIDERVDVFALGAILYEMLTGERLYKFTDSMEGLQLASACRFDRSLLGRSGITGALREICLTALAANPRDRYQTAGDLASALRAQIAPSSVRRLPLAAAMIAFATLALLIAWKFAPPTPPGPETTTKQVRANEVPGGDVENLAGGEARLQANRRALLREGIIRGGSFTHYAMTDAGDVPGPLFENGSVREEDGLRIEVEFDSPVYCFLIALNPDGVVQLCFPEDSNQPQSEPLLKLGFPESVDHSFGFTDGAGQQTFILVQSNEALPPFDRWLENADSWPAVAGGIRGRWIWEDGAAHPWQPASETRGTVRQLAGAAAFADLLRTVSAHAPRATVRAISFPVDARGPR